MQGKGRHNDAFLISIVGSRNTFLGLRWRWIFPATVAEAALRWSGYWLAWFFRPRERWDGGENYVYRNGLNDDDIYPGIISIFRGDNSEAGMYSWNIPPVRPLLSCRNGYWRWVWAYRGGSGEKRSVSRRRWLWIIIGSIFIPAHLFRSVGTNIW